MLNVSSSYGGTKWDDLINTTFVTINIYDLVLHDSRTCFAGKGFTGAIRSRYTDQQPGTKGFFVPLIKRW